MMIELNKIYNEDCLEGMKRIPDGSVDCIICDLPYGTTACKWDTIIPFEPLWKQYKRVVKPDGAIVLFCCQPFTSVLVASNIKHYKHHLIWLKNRGTVFQVAKFRPMMQTEDIIVFNNKGSLTYNPQMIKLKKPYFARNASGTNGTNPLANFNRGGKMTDEKHPTNVLPFDKEVSPQHPTQKPVNLIGYLIKTYTNEGETVLDNCMGSGTTAIAAIRTKRNFIGFELNKEYFDIANKRIKAEQQQLSLF
jgi:site-specific DNA-methyltransferase (adenine-specific)